MSGGIYICDGAIYSPTNTRQIISASSDLSVNIKDTFWTKVGFSDSPAIQVNQTGTGTTSITSSGDVVTTGSGSTALEVNVGSNGGALSITQNASLLSIISGVSYGINATQNGDALLTINTSGTVIGGTAAINATHNGEGTLEIDTSGKVTSLLGTGIVATHTADSSGDLIIRTYSSGSVYGSVAGINATQDGGDDLKIYTDGAVSSSLLGIGVKATNNGTGALSIDTREGGTVTGGVAGIYATNNGQNSTTSINTSGKVEGSYTPLLGPTIYLGAGIYAVQGTDAGSLTITEASTGSITGGLAGILAVNQGNSTTTVTISGSVEARGIESADSLSSILNNISDLGNSGSLLGGVGIGVVNGTTTTGLTINQDTATSTISGGAFGILAYNDGKGAAANVITSGKVDSDGVGIAVINGSDAGDLNINQQSSSVITGGMIGIGAVNDGTGITSIVTSGEVKEASFAGITATNGGSTGGLFIE